MNLILAFTTTMLAQADGVPEIAQFKTLLAQILLLVGIICIAYGGYLISRGHQLEGLLCLLGGALIAMAVPIITYLAQIAGISI